MKSDAFFSPCRKFRWKLTRKINASSKELIFIGLNPSFAGVTNNDSTLNRIIDFCDLWGYGSLTVINLFGRIEKNPKRLISYKDPVGSKNDFELNTSIQYWFQNDICDLWIGWGVNGTLMNKNEYVLRKIQNYNSKRPYVIGLTKDGHPRHPLYTSKKSLLYLLPR